jgi:hypothetical protein
MSFKIGDRVRLLEDQRYDLLAGSLGTVYNATPLVGVFWDGFERGHCGDVPSNRCDGWVVHPHEIELVPVSALDRLEASMNEAIALVEAGS